MMLYLKFKRILPERYNLPGFYCFKGTKYTQWVFFQFPSMSLSILSTVKQKVDKINSTSRALSRNGRWICIMPLDCYRLAQRDEPC